MNETVWNHEDGTIEHVVEVARCLGFVSHQFTRSFGDFMDSPVTAKNELTISAWVKAKDVGVEFLEALVAFDAAAETPETP